MSDGAPFRDRLLDLLGSPAGRARLFEPLERVTSSSTARDPAALRDRFSQELLRVGGEVHDLTGAPDLRGALGEILRGLVPSSEGTAARPQAAFDRDPVWEKLPEPSALLLEAGFDSVDVAAGDSRAIKKLAGATVGITIADLALAETGSILQLDRPWRARSISLLPPVHLVIVPEGRLLGGFEDLFEAAAGHLGGSSGYMTLITGPSRTADIEKVLTIGVHGPGKVAAALVS